MSTTPSTTLTRPQVDALTDIAGTWGGPPGGIHYLHPARRQALTARGLIEPATWNPAIDLITTRGLQVLAEHGIHPQQGKAVSA